MVKRIRSDSGLMGPTHALSAVAISLLFAWLARDFMFNTLLGSKDIVVFISAIIIIIGASLMPDLDAVNSTSINVLGIAGATLSTGMRAFSSVIQNLIKGPYDKSSDPHRGFWHTFLSAFVVGALISAITSINVKIFILANDEITIASLVVIFIIYISLQLTMASLAKPFYKKKGNKIIVKIGILMISVLLLLTLPKDLNYRWVGAAVTFGWIVHLLGDLLTVSGVPVLFPLKHKGKRWWNFRSPVGIKANGLIENSILIPLFLIIIAISLYNIMPLLK